MGCLDGHVILFEFRALQQLSSYTSYDTVITELSYFALLYRMETPMTCLCALVCLWHTPHRSQLSGPVSTVCSISAVCVGLSCLGVNMCPSQLSWLVSTVCVYLDYLCLSQLSGRRPSCSGAVSPSRSGPRAGEMLSGQQPNAVLRQQPSPLGPCAGK